ncbi:DoxX family protein [Antrihabitans sp. YC2-6]|uniref:DoxX family protein n=1 Tax=Antrihabitans sp. YC2-6 TaxID=2799498 RepID=UPI0018F46E4F|nr:DoxX family protein [Antrihabitans sp. YC2-6]MBJ8348103.1 DoxX family protein [Antrihabitans sp. YC2-6]
MNIAAIVCSVVLALAALWSARDKVALKGRGWTSLRNRGYSEKTVRSIGIVEIVAAIGLIIGIFFGPVGLFACIVFMAVLIWAIGQHVTYGDYGNPDTRNIAFVPLGVLLLAIVTLVCVLAASG